MNYKFFLPLLLLFYNLSHAKTIIEGEKLTESEFWNLVSEYEKKWSDFVKNVELDQDFRVLVSDKRIYANDEEPNLFYYYPLGRSDGKIIIKKNGAEILEENINFENARDGVITLTPLEIGRYEAQLKDSEGRLTETSFSVSEFTLSPLVLRIKDQKLVDNKIKIEFLLSILGNPYNGDVNISLKCGACNNSEIVSTKISIKDGNGISEFDIRGHGGPYELTINTSDGHTASSLLSGTKREEMRPVLAANISRNLYASLYKGDSEFKIRGMELWREDFRSSDAFVVNDFITDSAKVTVAKDLRRAFAFIVDPWQKKFIFKKYENGLKKTDLLTFDVNSPFINIFIVVDEDGIRKNYFSTFFKPLPKFDFNLSNMTPREGDEIKLTLSGPKGTRVLASLIDQRIDQDKVAMPLARIQLSHIEDTINEGMRGRVETLDIEGVISRERRFDGVLSPMVKMSTEGVETKRESDQPMDFSGVQKINELSKIILYKILELKDGTLNYNLKLPDGARDYRLNLFFYNGFDFEEKSLTLSATADYSLDVDVPKFIFSGEESEGRVEYSVKEPSFLEIRSDGKIIEKVETKNNGNHSFKINNPGKYLITILGHEGQIHKNIEFDIHTPGRANLLVSNVFLSDKNKKYNGKVTIYPSPIYLAEEVSSSLLKYPFGCAEQTSSKLSGLATLYKAIKSGVIDLNISKTERYITGGLNRIKNLFFHGDDGFSLWEGGKPENGVTAVVLKNLKPFTELLDIFPVARELIDGGAKALSKSNFHDDSLISFNPKFRSNKTTLYADIFELNYLTQNKKIDSASASQKVERIKKEAVSEGDYLYWKSPEFWGRNLEATCEALRALILAGDLGLLKKGFGYIGREMVEGRLKTTSDTKAFIELLVAMSKVRTVRAEIDGEAIDVKNKKFASSIKTLSDDTLIKLTEEKEIDYTNSRADFPFEVKYKETKGSLGSKFRIEIIPNYNEGERPLVPVARVYLPPMISLVTGGVNVQAFYEPIKGGRLVIEGIGVRKGAGSLLVIVHDMYDTERVGVSPRIAFEIK